jgi:hypothetical protein
MCELCRALQVQIDRFKRILSYGFDPLTEQRLREAIHDLEKRIANCPMDCVEEQ